MYAHVREKTRQYLKDNGIKQKFVAKQIGITPAMFSYYLNDHKNLSDGKIEKLLKIIN